MYREGRKVFVNAVVLLFIINLHRLLSEETELHCSVFLTRWRAKEPFNSGMQ